MCSRCCAGHHNAALSVTRSRYRPLTLFFCCAEYCPYNNGQCIIPSTCTGVFGNCRFVWLLSFSRAFRRECPKRRLPRGYLLLRAMCALSMCVFCLNCVFLSVVWLWRPVYGHRALPVYGNRCLSILQVNLLIANREAHRDRKARAAGLVSFAAPCHVRSL